MQKDPDTTVDGSEIRLTTWDVSNLVNNGRNYQAQLVIAGFLLSTVPWAKYRPNVLAGCFWVRYFFQLQLGISAPLTVSGLRYPFPPVQLVPFNMFNVVLCGTLGEVQ